MAEQESAVLHPESLVSELKLMTTAELADQYRDTLMLLIELSGSDSELIAPLEQLSAVQAQKKRKYTPDIMTTLEVPAYAGAQVTEPDRMELLAKLESASWFVLPLFKRQRGGDADRIGVGRATDNDVVLKDRSVSAHHAYFELHEDGSLSLSDTGSTNGTVVNGAQVAAEERRWVQPMDQIRFGSVATFTCAPGVLRSVLRAIAV